jgi:4'-phosphopantetheinyl transferase
VLSIGPSDVHLWFCKTQHLAEETIAAAGLSLSTEERARRDRFHFATDRRDFAIAHDLLRRTLSRYTGVSPADWQFAKNKYGKPSIDSRDPHLAAISFSLSHTTGFVACGVALAEALGVDVERADRSLSAMQIAERYFSEQEVASLHRQSDEMRGVRFTELWTLKEAFWKAIGVGLSGSLASASFHIEERGRIGFDPPPGFQPAAWHFSLFDLDGDARLAVAVRDSNQPHFKLHEHDPGAP